VPKLISRDLFIRLDSAVVRSDYAVYFWLFVARLEMSQDFISAAERASDSGCRRSVTQLFRMARTPPVRFVVENLNE